MTRLELLAERVILAKDWAKELLDREIGADDTDVPVSEDPIVTPDGVWVRALVHFSNAELDEYILESLSEEEEKDLRFDNLLTALGWEPWGAEEEGIPVQQSDPGVGVILPGDVSRYAIIQREDYEHSHFVILCDTKEELEKELSSRVDEDYWYISSVRDLDTGKDLTYNVTVKVEDDNG